MQRVSRLVLALGLIAALLLSACAAPAAPAASTGSEAPAAGEAAGVTMSFWTRDSNQAQVRRLVDAWNATHDNKIEVTVIPASDATFGFPFHVAS